MPLSVPAGDACFIDANIFYYHYVNTPPHSVGCTDLLRRAVFGEVRAFTTVHALAETVHKVMLAEAVAKFGLTRAGLVSWLQRDPNRIRGLAEFRKVAEALGGLNVTVLSVDHPALAAAAAVSQAEGLMTNDAITVAVMRREGIANLATNDDDFDGVSGVAVFKPR
jgi:predicted nucleic acid-binding protein